MNQYFTFDGLKELATFPFKDPKWVSKFAIGSLVFLITIIIFPNPFYFGYLAQLERAIILEGREPFLPEWQDWDKLFRDGLPIAGAILIVALPMLIIMAIIFLPLFLPLLSIYFSDNPISSLDLILTYPLLFFAVFPVFMVVSILIGIVLPAAKLHVVTELRASALFRYEIWWKIFRTNISGFLIAYLLTFVFSYVFTLAFQFLLITIIFICIFPFVLLPFSYYFGVVHSTLYARVYRDGLQKQELQDITHP